MEALSGPEESGFQRDKRKWTPERPTQESGLNEIRTYERIGHKYGQRYFLYQPFELKKTTFYEILKNICMLLVF